MTKLLNRGLNFAIMPIKLNMTELLVNYQKFERTVMWIEYWANKNNENDDDNEDTKPKDLLKKKKTNLPSNPSPEVKTFLNGIKSELKDPLNRNERHPNLPPGELKALNELIKLQRNRNICIKPCDKGAGIIILKFEDYLDSCYNHLNSQQKQADGSSKPYYSEANESDLKAAKKEIHDVLKKALDDKIISENDFHTMDPSEKNAGKFYELFKVHKDHIEGKPPPERPIVSACGSITEYIG